eukprot:scaffold123484_cov29-Attheya_sp.AAC.1
MTDRATDLDRGSASAVAVTPASFSRRAQYSRSDSFSFRPVGSSELAVAAPEAVPVAVAVPVAPVAVPVDDLSFLSRSRGNDLPREFLRSDFV